MSRSVACGSRHLVLPCSGHLHGGPRVAQDFRVGFVNTDRIFRESTMAKAAQSKLEQEFSRREKDLQNQAPS
jgi:Skp family chaperone for outer membrane proteins